MFMVSKNMYEDKIIRGFDNKYIHEYKIMFMGEKNTFTNSKQVMSSNKFHVFSKSPQFKKL
jgi:hypothetical protein